MGECVLDVGTTELAALRARVRDWVSANLPPDWRQSVTGCEVEDFVGFQKDWFAKVAEAGFANAHWSAEWPGGGRSLIEQVAIFEELARNGAPRLVVHFISLYHAAMTLLEWGSPEQKAAHLPAILAGEIWCQGFSEPGAGSDLASLSTAAVRNGDHYVVNGQKIWSTMGHHARWCLLLVRTSSDGAKQAGITYLLMDMLSPGVTVRPIRQITGDEEFAEIFLQDVKIPVANRVGAEGQGWQVAQTTLSSERGLTLLELTERLSRSTQYLTDALHRHGHAEVQLRREAADVMIKIRALKAMISNAMARKIAGAERVGDSSIIKLYYAEVLREFTQLGLALEELDGQFERPFGLGIGQETGNWMFDFMNSYMWTIAGGSNEIQCNIIAERVLGMPREPAAVRAVAR